MSPRRGGSRDRRRRAWSVVTVTAVLLASCGLWRSTRDSEEEPGAGPGPPAATAVPLAREDLVVLAGAVSDTVAVGVAPPAARGTPRLRAGLGPVFAVVRDGGLRLASAWGEGASTLEGAGAAVSEALGDLPDAEARRVDTVELCLSRSFRPVTDLREDGLLTDVHVGIHGLELARGNDVSRYSPTLMLAENWDFDDVLERFAQAHDLAAEELDGSGVRARVFDCDQVLVTLRGPSATVMTRGNSPVRLGEVRRAEVERLGRLMGDWLTAQVQPDGRTTYEYWPSRREESLANNMVRQWMATVALGRLAAHRGGDRRVRRLSVRNLRYNLDHFYVRRGRLGLVVEPSDGDVKLGAVALAALAIMEHPRRRQFSREEAALRRTVDFLWRDDGSFRTFLRPAGRDDNQNFYPGEALLLWAHTYRETRDPALLERFMRSFVHYRRWHLDSAHRNPAFVPWHTQAYATVWRETRDPRLLDFVFRMNDWLLSMQQWGDAVHPDLRGRFYDPDRPQFGAPHSSSTGVYLEGLVEAWRLAVAVGDTARSERYWRSIRRGLRNVMQLQFEDRVDLYYVPDRKAARGGVRTEVYDNVIRVDNVQHNLMAVMEALASWPDRG